MVSKPWVASEKSVMVTLEMPEDAANAIIEKVKVYILYFAFRAQSHMPNYGCFKCLSFDHRVQDCKYGHQVCKRHGGTGHHLNNCKNEFKCRNCTFKGQYTE